MKKKILSIITALAMTLSIVSCGSSNDQDVATDVTNGGDNVVVIAVGSGFSTLDPSYVYEQNPTLIINACYETLFKFVDGNDEPQPSLAESYTFSEDGLELTVVLKDGTSFASGNPVTSADVMFSLNRTKNLKGNPSFICDTIGSIDAPDEKTVVIKLTEPDSAILSKLAYPACSIMDSAVVIENGGTDAEDAATTDSAQLYLDGTSAGSGMYVLVSYVPDEEIVLEKNENYWGESTNVDKYIIKLQDDSNTQMMGLSSGDIDIALNLTDDTVAELEGKDTITVTNTPTKTIGFIMMNMDESIGGPVSNPLVQEAIRNAVDYEGIQIVCGEGSITPQSFIQVGFMGSKGELDVTTARDLDKAKDLLAQAGYPDGFDIDLTMSELDMEGIPLLDLAQKVKDDLAAININVNIVQQNWSAGYGDDYRNGDLGFTIIYWGIDYNDPNVQLVFLPGQTVGLRANWTADGQDELNELYTAVLAENDNDVRSELLLQIQDKMDEQSPYVMLAQSACHVGYNNRLTGVNFSDMYRIDVTTVNVQ